MCSNILVQLFLDECVVLRLNGLNPSYKYTNLGVDILRALANIK